MRSPSNIGRLAATKEKGENMKLLDESNDEKLTSYPHNLSINLS